MSWLSLAFVAPFLWAIVAILDIHFVRDVYADEYDGIVVSGVFQSLPWLLVPMGLINFSFPDTDVAIFAALAGGTMIVSFFCYFRALFISNDATLMQTIWTLTIPVVPFLAWIILGEVLWGIHYVGIGLACLGILLFIFDTKVRKIGFMKIVLPMFGAIVFLALSDVIMKKAYGLSSEVDFWSLLLIFSFGATITSFAILVIGQGRQSIAKVSHIALLSGRNLTLFVLSESLSLMATIASQKAISLAPSVSFVTVIGALAPMFVMLISLGVVWVARDTRFDVSLYRAQTVGAELKIFAMMTVIAGIYVIV